MSKLSEEIGYHLEGDYYIPNVKGFEPKEEITKWGKRRIDYLKKSMPEIFPVLAIHMDHFDDAIKKQHEAEEKEKILKEKLKGKYGLTQKLFNDNQSEYRKQEAMMQNEIDSIIMEEIICTKFIFNQ